MSDPDTDDTAQAELPEATEPDANERTPERPHRIRVRFNPRRWFHATDGELADHTAWKTLLEHDTSVAPDTADTSDTEAPGVGSSGNGADADPVQSDTPTQAPTAATSKTTPPADTPAPDTKPAAKPAAKTATA